MGEGVAGEMGSFCWEGRGFGFRVSGFGFRGSEKLELADCYTGSSAALNGWGDGKCLEAVSGTGRGEKVRRRGVKA